MRWISWTIYAILVTFFAAFTAVMVLILGGNFLSATPRDIAYRNWHPESEICKDQWPDAGSTVLYDYDNDEERVQNEAPAGAADSPWIQKLRCAWQTHAIPRHSASTPDAKPPLKYHLAFLEFKEDGSPQPLRYGSLR